MLLVVWLLVLVASGFLIRSILILLGFFKQPVIASFERYGNPEQIYHPLLVLIFWALVIFYMIRIYVSLVAGNGGELFLLLLGAVLLSFGWYRLRWRLRRWLDRHLILPLWYRDLYQRTSRYERRRIAYMWLRLPPPTRSQLDANTSAFMRWTDLVIMGAVMEEDPGSIPVIEDENYMEHLPKW